MIDSQDVKAILFDMDGVLFSSTDCHARAYSEVLAPLGITDFHYPPFAGMRTDDTLRNILTHYNKEASDETLDHMAHEKQRLARLYLAEEGCVIEGAHELLRQLDGKFLLALASSASRGTIDIFLQKLNLPDDTFDVVLDGSQVKHAKPAPDIYLRSAELLGVNPRACIVVEDSVSGVAAGKAAGMRVIGIEGTDHTASLKHAGADSIVATLATITQIMGL